MDGSSGTVLPAGGSPGRISWFRPAAVVRDLRGLPPVLARVGSFELRLATVKTEVRRIQRLRYAVFYEEGDAIPDLAMTTSRRDRCPFDRGCDHLYVVDTAYRTASGRTKAKVVGTTRLLRSDVAATHHGFYSETEFVLAPLLDRHPDARLLELGRSCVHPDYRARRVIDLLWQGIGHYAAHHGTTALIGCSSLPGTHAQALALPLGFAFYHAPAPADWQVRAVPGRATRMDWLAQDAVEIRAALSALPPLVRAYVRVGGRFASDAVVDHQFGTMDLFTVLPFALASPRYLAQFGPGIIQA